MNITKDPGSELAVGSRLLPCVLLSADCIPHGEQHQVEDVQSYCRLRTLWLGTVLPPVPLVAPRITTSLRLGCGIQISRTLFNILKR